MNPSVPTLRFESVARVANLRQQVSAQLHAALISGAMRPGVLYSAPVLADMLGVSATPIREAMLDLVREGLVEVVRNKGFRVTELTDKDLDNFAQARLLLEVPTMGAVARQPDAARRTVLEQLRSQALAMERAAAIEDLEAFLRLDTQFHCAFLALAGNDEIVRIARSLRNRSRLYGLGAVARAGLLGQSAAEHGHMIDAALDGNEAVLEALVTHHIGNVRTLWAEDK
jgi:DNA-binding GntR family transcriptional regulator